MKRHNIVALAVAALVLSTSASAQKAPKPPKGGGGTVDTCGYPYGTAPDLSSVVFSESTMLQQYAADFTSSGNTIKVWYVDEHAMTLGVDTVVVKTAQGTTTTDYSSSFTPFDSTTLSAVSPSSPLPVGTTALTGAQAGTDLATWSQGYGYLDHGRPIWPALFITDITDIPTSTAGDWQQAGITAVPPNAVYGAWKGAVRTVDQTRTPWAISVTPDADPAKNYWTGVPDTPPAGFGTTDGYGTEVVWNLDSLGLVPGRTYRLQVMIHDGDQNKSGGDSGEACVTYTPSQGRQ